MNSGFEDVNNREQPSGSPALEASLALAAITGLDTFAYIENNEQLEQWFVSVPILTGSAAAYFFSRYRRSLKKD